LCFAIVAAKKFRNTPFSAKTLWVLTEQGRRMIQIAELDVPITTKAKEVRGIDFRLPPKPMGDQQVVCAGAPRYHQQRCTATLRSILNTVVCRV
jgi:hypothetical protein